ncbi:MAG: hypothetical protein PUP93_13510 [Rhizonema sp. NSF051]|nr:hypothetical protein [Rhizonema sp. NSF051]
MQPRSVKVMYISIALDTKKREVCRTEVSVRRASRLHNSSAIRGLKMSQVITELVEQCLKANEALLHNNCYEGV